ncbi:hypothetical protein SAMN06295888_1931 [Desulfonatronum zhilinae]|nr:hypothetical protein SAMN06295888_1931 [Desulfonatronum zhilinae]
MLPELFRPIEEDQKQKIRSGTAPFLSLFADQLLPVTRKHIKVILCAHSPQRTAEDIIASLYEWPALVSMHLTAELNAGLSDKFKIYPHIEGSSAKFVGEHWFGQISKCMI